MSADGPWMGAGALPEGRGPTPEGLAEEGASDRSRLGYRTDPELLRVLEALGGRLVRSLTEGTRREAPILGYGHPDEHLAALEPSVGLRVRPDEPAHPPQAILQAVETILARAVRSDHPRFFNQNWAGPDPVAVLGDWLTARLNTTAATYEMAPLFTLMENELLGRMAELAGFAEARSGSRPRTAAGAHGLFAPGGATSNLYAVHLARVWKDPDGIEHGLRRRLVAFTSAQSHYSIEKAMGLAGLGRANLVEVPCDRFGQMRPDALEGAIRAVEADGGEPFFVNATAGTTVTGAFDPLHPIADLADRHRMWLHVDGSYGGSVLMSARERGRLDGLERARSFAWNPHKMMGITQQCAVLLLRDGRILRDAFSADASYIFQPDKNEAALDLGDLTLQCGRRADGLKLWLTWKARGEGWFGRRIDQAIRLAEWLERRVDEDPRFSPAHPRSFVNVGFWWVPPDLRPLPPAEELPLAVKERLHRLAPRIKDGMQREGSAMLGYQPLGGLPNFFRLLVMSPDVRVEDLETTLEIIDRIGRVAEG